MVMSARGRTAKVVYYCLYKRRGPVAAPFKCRRLTERACNVCRRHTIVHYDCVIAFLYLN